MKPVTSWENFDIKSFNEMCCAGGACGISDFAPENVIAVTSVKEEKDDLKEDYKSEINPLADFISKLDLNSLEKDELPEIYMGESTTWEKFSLKEGDQAAPAQQVTAQTQPQANATQAPAQPATTQRPVTTTPAQVAPQSQIANPNAAAQQAQPANTQNVAQPVTAQQPQVQAANTQPQANQLPESITSWADYKKIKESIALPGGMLNTEPTEYEKELDKHNQARKNTKSPEVNIGDKDAGEIGVHEFDENGMPTGVKDKVETELKATEIKPNEKATIVDQKKKFKHWDD